MKRVSEDANFNRTKVECKYEWVLGYDSLWVTLIELK